MQLQYYVLFLCLFFGKIDSRASFVLKSFYVKLSFYVFYFFRELYGMHVNTM